MISTNTARVLALLAANGWLGCGDPQVDASYRGDALWQFKGVLQAGAPGVEGSTDIRAALFFDATSMNNIDPKQMVELTSSGTPITVPSSYTLNVFAPPGPEHMLHNPDGSSAGYGIARTFFYRDLDHDGRYTPGEPFLGGGGIKVLVYAPDGLPAGHTPTTGALPAGFTEIAAPQVCGTRPPATDPGTCGINLGNFCHYNTDCGANAICLNQTVLQFREGYCSLPDLPQIPCIPGAAAYLPVPPNSPKPPMGEKGYYLRPCNTDAECARPGELTQGNYACDLGLRGCVPTPPGYGLFILGAQYDVEPFCPT
jgi:hypothetical protein